MRALLCLLFCLLCLPLPTSANPCGGDTACALGDRSYHLRLPDGWDGVTPLPVLLHFHGWARQGDLVVGHPRIAAATARRGVLLVAPNGRRKTWDFWGPGRADVPFAAAVLADVAQAYPVDPDRIYVSGYSYGSAMAWRFACENGTGLAALLAVAGTLPQTTDCATAPPVIRHVHGTADTVMAFPVGAGGDLTAPVALWRRMLGCTDPGTARGPWQARDWLTFDRTAWTACTRGREVVLDIHPGGHFIPHGWIARQLDELLDLPHSYP